MKYSIGSTKFIPRMALVTKKAFGHKGRLMVVHTKEKRYQCSECGKAFGHKGTLKTHIVVHIGIRRFKCTICNKVKE